MQQESTTTSSATTAIVGAIIIVVVALLLWYWLDDNESERANVDLMNTPMAQLTPEQQSVDSQDDTVDNSAVVEEPLPEKILPEVAPESVNEPAAIEPALPALEESDALIQQKLSELTWRKELLKLVVNEDMVRRFVVFVDNFAQGNVAYKRSPLVLPSESFTAIEEENQSEEIYQWDKNEERRFALYIDLLRSFDTDQLIDWYQELKPLIDQAYAELGYPDKDFTETLLAAISRVLDREIPKEMPALIRPSVMYKYKDPTLETLPAADKLLLRLGKENLLVLKSVLLEVSDKISRIEEKNSEQAVN
jgi:hypothetical protein